MLVESAPHLFVMFLASSTGSTVWSTFVAYALDLMPFEVPLIHSFKYGVDIVSL